MVTFTANQWAILFLVLVLGWLLGLMSRSGGAKWRRAAADERAMRERVETERDAARTRLAEVERQRTVVVEDPAVVERRVVTEEPVVTEAAAERRSERAADKARTERVIVRGEDDIP